VEAEGLVTSLLESGDGQLDSMLNSGYLYLLLGYHGGALGMATGPNIANPTVMASYSTTVSDTPATEIGQNRVRSSGTAAFRFCVFRYGKCYRLLPENSGVSNTINAD